MINSKNHGFLLVFSLFSNSKTIIASKDDDHKPFFINGLGYFPTKILGTEISKVDRDIFSKVKITFVPQKCDSVLREKVQTVVHNNNPYEGYSQTIPSNCWDLEGVRVKAEPNYKGKNSQTEVMNWKELQSAGFDPTQDTMFLAHGFSMDPTHWLRHFRNHTDHWCVPPAPWLGKLATTLACHHKKYNIFFVNWLELAIPPYEQAAANTRGVGRLIANVLLDAKAEFSARFSLNRVHLVGFSLGAHVMGFAGNHITKESEKWNYKNEKIGRITGLDPASYAFDIEKHAGFDKDDLEHVHKLENLRLDKKDAHFVLIIHSDTVSGFGVYGAGLPFRIGDVDVYVNNATVQPHCSGIKGNEGKNMFTYPLDMFKTSVAAAFCDHMTAPMFFNDVVRRDSLKLKPITAYGYKNKTYGFNQMVTGLNQPLECTQLVNGKTETTGKCFSINMDIVPCNLEKNVDSYYVLTPMWEIGNKDTFKAREIYDHCAEHILINLALSNNRRGIHLFNLDLILKYEDQGETKIFVVRHVQKSMPKSQYIRFQGGKKRYQNSANYRTIVAIPCMKNVKKSLETMQVTLNYKPECAAGENDLPSSFTKLFGFRRLLCNRYPEINSFGFEVLPRYQAGKCTTGKAEKFSPVFKKCFCFKDHLKQFKTCSEIVCKRKKGRYPRGDGFASRDEVKSLRNKITFDFTV